MQEAGVKQPHDHAKLPCSSFCCLCCPYLLLLLMSATIVLLLPHRAASLMQASKHLLLSFLMHVFQARHTTAAEIADTKCRCWPVICNKSLLVMMQVDRALTPAEASVPPAPPSPVLTTESFQALCSGPPVQGPSVKRHARNFEPLSPEELKGPGLLLGIDAEFVAHAPAEKVMQGSAPSPPLFVYCMHVSFVSAACL